MQYSRQQLLPSIGAEGQKRLSSSRVLVVGCGGIGSTVISYLGAAGVPLVVCDHDKVELTNLHRQILHDRTQLGVNKALSAQSRMKALNPDVRVEAIEAKVEAENVHDLIKGVDVVVDATDNYIVRYLINDACMKESKVLVSGSAVGMEGQISVFIPGKGPCYRCLYPKPSALASCRSCADAGVLGPVPGMIGCLQATEVVKVLLTAGQEQGGPLEVLHGRQLIYDGTRGDFYTFKLQKNGNPSCCACGDGACDQDQVVAEEGKGKANNNKQVSAKDYAAVVERATEHVLLDVREPTQFGIASLPKRPGMHQLNISLVGLRGGRLSSSAPAESDAALSRVKEATQGGTLPIYVLCRRGVDSEIATAFLADKGLSPIFNVTGGLVAWSKDVDAEFPIY